MRLWMVGSCCVWLAVGALCREADAVPPSGLDLSNAPPLRTEPACVPVRSSRAWSTALAPNARGGLNFITQYWEYPSTNPVEYVVLDLETGETKITEGPSRRYTNSNYQHRNQVRASNGRIFFAESGPFLTWYDPTDESIKEVGQMFDPAHGDKFIFKLEFGPDGMLYAGTQANEFPSIARIDPVTLQFKVLGRVGKNRLSYSYAYNLAVDPPWVYVGVGQNPWELAAIHAETGESKVLHTCDGAGWIDFDLRKEGIVAKTASNRETAAQKSEVFWCVDGAIVPFDPKYDPAQLPFKPRSVARPSNPVANPPELNLSMLNADSDGVCRILSRTAGSTNAWKETKFQVRHTSPIAIESLLALPDGTLLGNTKQYHGFFRYDPKAKTCVAYGAHGPSGGPRVMMDGLAWICGYPSSGLYAFDPTKTWTSNRLVEESADGSTARNPVHLGYFAQKSGTHYAYFLLPSGNGRLYFGGRRERTGIGGGVGFYEPSTKTFAGHHEKLSFLTPRGMVVIDDLQRVVYSGRLQDDPAFPGQTPAEAQLVVYDRELNEVERLTVKPGIKSTGQLFLCPAASKSEKRSWFQRLFGGREKAVSPPRTVIVGLVDEEKAMYRYDLAAKRLLEWVPVPAEFNATIQKPNDGSLWTIMDGALVRIDPVTLHLTVMGKFPAAVTRLAWLGNDLYAATGEGSGYAAGAELHRVSLPAR